MSQFMFNSNQVPGDHGEVEQVPDGIYNAAVTKVEEQKPNEKGTQTLLFIWTVADGEHRGKTVRNYVTFSCPSSQQAQEIGLRFIKNICQSIGKPSVSDTNDFLGIAHVVKVGRAEPKKGSSKVYPEVKMTYPKGAAAAAPQPAATQPPDTQATAKPPWA